MSEPNIIAENEKPASPTVEIVNEEIVENVLEQEWLEGNPIEEVVIAQDGTTDYVEIDDEIIQSEMQLEYDDLDNYPSLLPIRDGVPLFTLNLPDLLSRTITFTNNEKMILCFNKKCQRQISFGGYLYTIAGYVSETSWNVWTCVNPICEGSVRSSPTFQELRVRTEHSSQCIPDNVQVRLRINVYDLRLTAEFTDIRLEVLHSGFEARIRNEQPDLAAIFPSFSVLKNTLEDHRVNKIYRKRFEMQTLKDKQRKMNMTPDEVIYAESTSGLVRFKRTKAFPPSICFECGEQFSSSLVPSQDTLVTHLLFSHGRQIIIERYDFKDINQFEQYMRELNIFSKFKMKKMGLADENMYYLCSTDDRLNKSGTGRAGKSQEQHSHCTAFIRVFDWRIVTKRENQIVTVDYCLDHNSHDETISTSKDEVGYFTPEVFIRDVEERRIRTQKMLEDGHLQRIKRPMEVRPLVPTARIRPSFGSRAMAPPIAAQLAGGNSQPYVDTFFNAEEQQSDLRKRYPIRFPKLKLEAEASTSASTTNQPQIQQSSRTTQKSQIEQLQLQPVQIRMIASSSTRNRVTDRGNFKDIYTYNAVVKIEDACTALVARLQKCQNNRIALGYKEKITNILRKATTDKALSEHATLDDIEQSWVIGKGVRGRPKKRPAAGNDTNENDDEDEDEDNATVSSVTKTEDVEIAPKPTIKSIEIKETITESAEINEKVDQTIKQMKTYEEDQGNELKPKRPRKLPARLIE